MGRKHNHYFKDIEGLTELDVYRMCDLFRVNDPSGATQHALKKLLLPGERGAGKDRLRDYKEAIDTLVRRVEMWEEDEVRQVRLYGVPVTVVKDLCACTTMDQASELVLNGATSLKITPEFYKILKDKYHTE